MRFSLFPQTPDQYQIEYDSRRGAEYSRFHGYTYDGIWTVALAVKHVARRIRHFHRNQTISDFRYRDILWEKLFLDALRNTSFDGVTVSWAGWAYAVGNFAPRTGALVLPRPPNACHTPGPFSRVRPSRNLVIKSKHQPYDVFASRPSSFDGISRDAERSFRVKSIIRDI